MAGALEKKEMTSQVEEALDMLADFEKDVIEELDGLLYGMAKLNDEQFVLEYEKNVFVRYPTGPYGISAYLVALVDPDVYLPDGRPGTALIERYNRIVEKRG